MKSHQKDQREDDSRWSSRDVGFVFGEKIEKNGFKEAVGNVENIYSFQVLR